MRGLIVWRRTAWLEIRYREMVLAEEFVVQEIVENCLTSTYSKCNAGVERSTVVGERG